jgi:hypothetical protein
MLVDRIIGAFTFRKEVYAEVERDSSFTNTAWALVAVVALLNQLGSRSYDTFINRIFGSVVGTVVILVGFALGIWVINFIGRSLFNADVTFNELVRTLGLAYVWNVVGFIGILASFSGALGCVLAPALLVAGLLGLIAWFVAAKEALDLEWTQTIVTVIIGWAVMIGIGIVIGGVIISALGLSAAILGGISG